MNLIWITPEFPSSKTNTKGIYIYRTVKELAKHYNLYVICLYPASPPIVEMLKYWKDRKEIYREWEKNYPKTSNLSEEFGEGKIIYLRYYRLPRGKFHHIEGWFAYIQAKKHLKKIITKDSVIHSNWIIPSGTMAYLISKKYKVPFIVSMLGCDVNALEVGSKSWKASKIILKYATKLTAVSQALIDTAKQKKIISEKTNVELLDNIYQADKFIILEKNEIRNKLNIPIDQKMVLFVGGLMKLKNVNILIEAFAELNNSMENVHLYIAGTGTEETELKKLAENKNATKAITFLGPLLPDALVEYYNAADVFSLQSSREGLPNVIVESFFCGTPVVATKVGGIPTIVKDGINGYLVEVNSVSDLSAKIKLVLNQNWDRQKIRDSISHFLPEKVIGNYHKLYNSLN